MDRDRLAEALTTTIGLSPSAADAYLTLVEHGVLAAREVGERSDVPTGRIYDVLHDLEAEGYVDLLDGETLHARATDPDRVIEAIREERATLDAAASEIERRWTAPDTPDQAVSVVKRPESVYDAAADAIVGAESVVYVGGDPEHLERLAPAMETAVENGLDVRAVVCPREESADVPVESAVTRLRLAHERVQFAVFVDHQRAFVGENVRHWGEFGLIVDSDHVALTLLRAFWTTVWQFAEPYYWSDRFPVTYASVRGFVYELRPLLADGATATVTIGGTAVGSGEPRTVAGRVADVRYPLRGRAPRAPLRIGQLRPWVTLVVEEHDEPVTVGGWGAVHEDVEAHRIRLDELRLEAPHSE